MWSLRFHHVSDIVPTIYEAVGIEAPEHVEGTTQMPLDGVSMVYTWNLENHLGSFSYTETQPVLRDLDHSEP